LIESGIVTFASCHESYILEDVLAKIEGKVEGVIADKGYASDERKRRYRGEGIYYGILEKRKAGQKVLNSKQKKKK